MTPMVAEVPKDVPVSTESRQFNRKVISTMMEGLISTEAQETSTGMVPAMRQRAVSMPMRRKVSSTFRAVNTPITAICRSSFQENPFVLPYSMKITRPAARAARIGRPVTRQTIRARTNSPSVSRSDIITTPVSFPSAWYSPRTRRSIHQRIITK